MAAAVAAAEVLEEAATEAALVEDEVVDSTAADIVLSADGAGIPAGTVDTTAAAAVLAAW